MTLQFWSSTNLIQTSIYVTKSDKRFLPSDIMTILYNLFYVNDAKTVSSSSCDSWRLRQKIQRSTNLKTDVIYDDICRFSSVPCRPHGWRLPGCHPKTSTKKGPDEKLNIPVLLKVSKCHSLQILREFIKKNQFIALTLMDKTL